MNCLSKKFNANDTALNVKIFILKLLVNVPQVRLFVYCKVSTYSVD